VSKSAPSDQPWLSGRRARLRAGGLTATALLKLAARGLVRTLALPGEALQYSAADIDQLAQTNVHQGLHRGDS
jgi:hypothetical protein